MSVLHVHGFVSENNENEKHISVHGLRYEYTIQ